MTTPDRPASPDDANAAPAPETAPLPAVEPTPVATAVPAAVTPAPSVPAPAPAAPVAAVTRGRWPIGRTLTMGPLTAALAAFALLVVGAGAGALVDHHSGHDSARVSFRGPGGFAGPGFGHQFGQDRNGRGTGPRVQQRGFGQPGQQGQQGQPGQQGQVGPGQQGQVGPGQVGPGQSRPTALPTGSVPTS